MAEMWVPVVKTSLTTAVGFLSFALSPIGPVRAFGLFTAVGIIFCMLWSLTVIPALLAVISPKRLAGRPSSAEGHRTRPISIAARFATVVVRFRYAVLGLAFLVGVVAPLGVRRIVVQDSWIDGFAADSEFYKAIQFFNEQFLGMHTLLVCVDTGPSDSVTGRIAAGAVDHHDVRLPAEGLGDPAALVGQRIYLRRPDAPPPSGHPEGRVPRPATRPEPLPCAASRV